MKPFDFLLICVLSFLLGVLLGFLSKLPKREEHQPTALKPHTIVYEISEQGNSEQRNFLSYDGSEQN